MSIRVLLTGRPGIGKTTVIQRTVDMLAEAGCSVSGFWTIEVRESGRRVGFDLVLAPASVGAGEPKPVPLARVGLESEVRVGRYGVDTSSVSDRGLPALRQPADVVVLDEIAPMELAAPGFRDAVQDLFDDDRDVLATVHHAADGFVDGLKHRPDVELVTVTSGNRDDLPRTLAGRFARPE